MDKESTQRDHLEAAAKRGDRRARAALRGPICPAGAEYIWHWFRQLEKGRGGSGFGMSPISWAELESFARLWGVQMSALEIDWLRALDRARLTALAPEDPKK